MSSQGKSPAEPHFQISPQWFEERNISLSVFLLPRLCRECREGITARPDKGVGVPWEEVMERIAEHCSQEPGFITEQTPLLEGVFRLLLGARNQPVPLSSLKEALEEWWGHYDARREVSEATLLRVLQRSGAYGIRQVAPP
ncbi:hypothetical protein HRbin23_00513 [bacterium HR23]|nr:hypothetical protein HRbin23_00513 [bacterium HR23]